MSELMSFVLGLLVGLATNLASWWILAHYLVPAVEFSPSIGRIPLPPGENDRCGYRYRIKLRNRGRRGIIDVELAATLRIAGITERKNFRVIAIPWNSEGEKRAHIVRLPPVKPGVKAARVLRLYINSVDEFRTIEIYPEGIREKARARTLTLEDILGLGTRAWIEIAAFGYDEYSGARKLFLSKSYTLDDVKAGAFNIDNLDVVTSDAEASIEDSDAINHI